MDLLGDLHSYSPDPDLRPLLPARDVRATDSAPQEDEADQGNGQHRPAHGV